MAVEQNTFVYFKDEAKRLGMENVKTASDIEIWCYIMKHQEEPKNEAFIVEYCNS